MSANPTIIATTNLAKDYGRIRALKGVTISVSKGEIYGLLGQNGAGKTTLIKVLLGLTRGWDGAASVLNLPAGNVEARKRIGYLPEDHRFPEYHTAFSLLDFYGQLLGVSRVERQKRIPELLDMVELKDRMHYKIRTYSKGMKQRVGVAQAMLQDPELIFLDEPTDGVDPLGRREIRQIMERLKSRGVTIFLNSHLLSEVEKICDRVGILDRGLMIREGDIETLTRQKGLYRVGLAPGQEFPAEEFVKRGYAVEAVSDVWEFRLTEEQSIDPVVDLLRGKGLSIRYLVEKRQSLEELFIATVSDQPRERDDRGRGRDDRGRDERGRDDQRGQDRPRERDDRHRDREDRYREGRPRHDDRPRDNRGRD